MSEKILYLIRHAHRDKPRGQAFDNGLSPKGKLQAKRIRKKLGKTHGTLISSPKIRCKETLMPLSKKLGTSLRLDPHLLEQFESKALFEKRIQGFFRSWKRSKSKVTFACSHGDWIPTFTKLFLGNSIALRKGGWMEFRLQKNKLKLYEVIQEP
jgi:broad specificity phosphatase PhoE